MDFCFSLASEDPSLCVCFNTNPKGLLELYRDIFCRPQNKDFMKKIFIFFVTMVNVTCMKLCKKFILLISFFFLFALNMLLT